MPGAGRPGTFVCLRAGCARSLPANPQFAVRAYEVETVTLSGQHRYTVAIDIDATSLA